jgi:tetratricopeptide (TPR) repeat protein
MSRSPHVPRLLAGLAGLGVAAVLAWAFFLRPEAPLPDPPAEVGPSAEFVNAEASIDYYRARLRRNPDEVRSWASLAQVLLQQGAATGREGDYLPEAQDALAEALRRAPADVHARLLQGSLYNTLHRFEDARDVARQLLTEHPHLAYAHGILVDALVELGEYDAAVAAADAMIAVRPGIASYSRASYLRELHGDTEGAIAAMRMAADAGMGGRADRAWALYNLAALYLAAAEPDTAAYLFEGLLEERPGYPYAVAGLGHVALVRGDADEAVRRFRQAHALAPRDVFLELLAEAYAVKGDARRADEALDGVADALADARAMGEVVDMEEADFLLDRGQDVRRALRMAAAQLRRRPDHLHANETYAWALHHNGRSADAIPFIEHALRLNTGDAMAHHRAAQIYRAAGRPADAARHTRLALANHLDVESPTAAADARTTLAALESSGAPVQTAGMVR